VVSREGTRKELQDEVMISGIQKSVEFKQVEEKVRPASCEANLSPADSKKVEANQTISSAKTSLDHLGIELATVNVKLNIRVDPETGTRVVKVIDRDTGDVLREIPPEELVRLEANIERMIGIFFDRQT